MKIAVLGATSAIAQAAARVWAARGESLLLVARNPEKLDAVAADLRTRGAQVETLVLDLDQFSAALAGRASLCDVVLVAQGVLHGQPEALLRTNLTAPIEFISALQLKPGSCIAAISSVAGDRGRAKNAVYGASKAGLDAFLSALRQKLSRSGVRVLTIKPGLVDTPMTADEPRSPLMASAETVGRGIVKAVDGSADVVYLPAIWRLVMFIVRSIPERIFRRLSF